MLSKNKDICDRCGGAGEQLIQFSLQEESVLVCCYTCVGGGLVKIHAPLVPRPGLAYEALEKAVRSMERSMDGQSHKSQTPR